jgi:hypothetical protein
MIISERYLVGFVYITYLLNEEGDTFASGKASQPGFTSCDEG